MSIRMASAVVPPKDAATVPPVGQTTAVQIAPTTGPLIATLPLTNNPVGNTIVVAPATETITTEVPMAEDSTVAAPSILTPKIGAPTAGDSTAGPSTAGALETGEAKTSTKDKPPEPAVVCVPLILNAFVLNETLCDPERRSKIAPLNLPDYSALGHGSMLKADVLPQVDLHAASPASVNTRISDVSGTGAARPERLGVYLHWTLPKAFRSGLAATDSASGTADHDTRRLEAGLPKKDEKQQTDDPEVSFLTG
jgi:hypothetical protein